VNRISKCTLITLLLGCSLNGATSETQITSPKYNTAAIQPRSDETDPIGYEITFTGLRPGISITDQFAFAGIIFNGNSSFVADDLSSTSSPALSGTPLFEGAIEGYFVTPDTDQLSTVSNFSLKAGYFDATGSVRIQFFDSSGKLIKQQISSETGYQTFAMAEGGIASFRIETIADEPSGFSIDNIRFEFATSSIAFREKKEAYIGSFYFPYVKDEVPGYDHAGLNFNGDVYESHPGYFPDGTFLDANGNPTEVSVISGPQQEHTIGSLLHYSKTAD